MSQRDKEGYLLALHESILDGSGREPTKEEWQVAFKAGFGLLGELLRDVGRIADAADVIAKQAEPL